MWVLIFVAATLGLSGSILADGEVLHATVFLIGSVVGFAGGSGMRASFYRGNRKIGAIIGLGFLLAGGGAVLYLVGVVTAFGFRFSGDNWVFVAFAVGFLAARPGDVDAREDFQKPEDDVALGTVAPIAAELVAGKLTPEQAEKRIRDSAVIAPTAPALWNSMNADEQEALGHGFMRLANNPESAARIEKHLRPLKQAKPDLWEHSVDQARVELGSNRNENSQ